MSLKLTRVGGRSECHYTINCVAAYLAVRRDEIHRRMAEAMEVLDGSTKARVALLTGIPAEEIDRLGGIDE